MNDDALRRAMDALCRMLAEHSGQELSESRLWRIETALRPLMRQRKVADLVDLVARVEAGDRDLFAHTLDAMLNHESSFYRDLAVFQGIERDILPALRENAREKVLRIWSAGCSTGKEPYSIAMMLQRAAPMWAGWRISIIATDVSPLSIETARSGLYNQLDVQRGLGIDDLLRWFEPVGEQWQISQQLRDMVRFQTDNLLDPRAVAGTFDLILCRNVMLYFPPELRAKGCEILGQHCRPDGFLVLGAGEMPVCTGRWRPSQDLPCTYNRAPPVPHRLAS